MSDDSRFCNVLTALPCVIETINTKTLTIRHYPGILLRDGRRLLIDEPKAPKWRRSHEGAADAAVMLLARMRKKVTSSGQGDEG